MGRRVGLPTRYLALARLARRKRNVYGLLHRLEDRLGVETQHRADPGCLRGAKVRDMVLLVFVQADALHEVDLNLVAHQDAADHIRPAEAVPRAALLRRRENCGMLSPGCE